MTAFIAIIILIVALALNKIPVIVPATDHPMYDFDTDEEAEYAMISSQIKNATIEQQLVTLAFTIGNFERKFYGVLAAQLYEELEEKERELIVNHNCFLTPENIPTA